MFTHAALLPALHRHAHMALLTHWQQRGVEQCTALLLLLPLGSCPYSSQCDQCVRNAQATEPAPLSDAALTLGVSQDLSPSALVLKVCCAFSK